MNTGQLLAEQIARTREWTLMIIDDLAGDDWFFQPQPGLHHALWICGHLASAQDTLLFTRCLNKPRMDEEFKRHFPIGSPILSATQHNWPSPERVLQVMDDMQNAAIESVQALSDSVLNEPACGKDGAKHPHYDNKRQAISHLIRHEAFHAGQLALLRRLMGKSFLR